MTEQEQPSQPPQQVSDLDRLVRAVEREFDIHKRRARLLWGGIIAAVFLALMVGAHMFQLIESMSDDMNRMSSYMEIMQGKMQLMAGEGEVGNMGTMATRMVEMAGDMKAMRGDMGSMSTDMQAMRGQMASVPAMQQDVNRMTSSVQRMQYDTDAMRWGVLGMRHDTANMGYPFQVMNNVTPW